MMHDYAGSDSCCVKYIYMQHYAQETFLFCIFKTDIIFGAWNLDIFYSIFVKKIIEIFRQTAFLIHLFCKHFMFYTCAQFLFVSIVHFCQSY